MKAEIILHGGPVITVDKDNSIAEAVAIADGRILHVGSKESTLKLAESSTKLIDLNGRSLIPGIIDSHLHMAIHGINATAVDCRPSAVTSIDDIKEAVKAAAQKAPKGQWIRGWGYDHSKLKENRHPNKWDLDEVSPDNPVILTRVCNHISVHNSNSLAMAGITDRSIPPEGGTFELIDNQVSGVMFENAHMEMMKVSMPSKEEMVRGMEVASKGLLEEGITSVHDSGGYGPVQMAAFQEAIASGKVKQRIYSMVFSFIENTKLVNDYLDIGIHTGFGNERHKLGPIKLMIDGSSSGPTAATLKPYTSNPDSCGIMSMEQDEIDEIVMRAHKGGWQITCHAVGDKAITAIIDAMERAMKAHPRENVRHRIEHSAMMNDALMDRIKKLGIIPVPQPVFLYEFGDGYLVNYGQDRAYRMFPCKSFIEEGVPCAGSSDCPITYSNPFLNMYMAVNRKTQTGQIINDQECVEITDALRMFTYNGARASFEENIKGSIEPGKLADLVVLSEDILKTPKEELLNIKADITMINGKIEYER